MNLEERYADKDTQLINIWAELLDNWRAVNKARTELKIAENNYSITKDRFFKLLGSGYSQRYVVLDGSDTYVVELDTNYPSVISVDCADRRTIFREKEGVIVE